MNGILYIHVHTKKWLIQVRSGINLVVFLFLVLNVIQDIIHLIQMLIVKNAMSIIALHHVNVKQRLMKLKVFITKSSKNILLFTNQLLLL